MTPEQALGNFAALINLGIQRGLFQSADEVHAMTEAHNVLAKLIPPAFVDGGTVNAPNYVSSNTGTSADLPTATTLENKIPENAKS